MTLSTVISDPIAHAGQAPHPGPQHGPPRRVLITAGANGIGLELARAFAATGARVMVCDVSISALESLPMALPGAIGQWADVSREDDVASMFGTVDQRLGGLDVLVNNAGVAGPSGPLEGITLADWERTLAVNLTGQFLCARQAIPRLRAAQAQRADAAARQGLAWGGACIINLSSAAGHLGMPGRAAYSASKWAVVGLSKTLALELGPEGIRVNAILPGAVEGPRIRAVMAARAQATGRPVDQVARDYTGQSALGRLVTAQDIAQMAVFVASDAAASITGQSLAVDGLTQALS
ncbi:MAG: SDR family oxidoreductase [Curvibacter sp.]|nr:MAG: SDR family oxidoreductase [Curvibacter sp.]